MLTGKSAARCLLVFLLTVWFNVCNAQVSEVWSSLKPGTYDVGFKTVEKYDYSRTLRAKRDYFGNLRGVTRDRPIQVAIWYPAQKHEDAPTMIYGEYMYAYPNDESFIPFLTQLHIRESNAVAFLFRDGSVASNLINVPFFSYKDVPPADGRFPLIIYHPDWQSSYCENALLCEYLASHGYVVATTHPVDDRGIRMQNITAVTTEAVIRDREFVLSILRDETNVDFDKLGLLGYGKGGISALLMQMRNGDVEAVVTLGGAFFHPNYMDLLRNHLSYNPLKMIVPHMMLYAGDQPSFNPAEIDSLLYSRRYMLQIAGATHTAVNQYRMLGGLLGYVPEEEIPAINNTLEVVCESTLGFFDGYLKDDTTALKSLESIAEGNSDNTAFSSTMLLAASQAPPSEEQFVEILQSGGILRALEIYTEVKAQDPDYVPFSEGMGNRVGYQQLQMQNIEEAVAMLRTTAELYPQSANAWDSYADACLAAGDSTTALECYRKVLEVLPNDNTINPQTREIVRNNAEQFINENK